MGFSRRMFCGEEYIKYNSLLLQLRRHLVSRLSTCSCMGHISPCFILMYSHASNSLAFKKKKKGGIKCFYVHRANKTIKHKVSERIEGSEKVRREKERT